MPLPRWAEAQLSKLVETAPTGPQWVHEIKFDGYRMAARIDRGKVELLTRSGLDWTAKVSGDGRRLRQAAGEDGLHRRRALRRPRRRRDFFRADAAVRRCRIRRLGPLRLRPDRTRRSGRRAASAARAEGAVSAVAQETRPRASSTASMRAATARRFEGRRVSMGSKASSPSGSTARTCRATAARGSRASASTAPSLSSSDGPTPKVRATSLVRSCSATTTPKAD